MSGAEWPWYEVVTDDSLDQGDIIPGCYVLVAVEPSAPDTTPKAKLRPITALVVTQTCDLIQGKTNSIIVCAVWTLASAVLQEPTLRQKAEEACKREKLGELPDDDAPDANERMERIIEKSGPLRGHLNAIIKGDRPAYAMLPAHDRPTMPKSIVSFEHVYSLPKSVIVGVARATGSRVRLRPPTASTSPRHLDGTSRALACRST